MSTVTIFQTGDGQQYLLDAPKYKGKVVLQEEAFGMPDIEYVTQRGPFQHGETLVDYFLRPRVIQLLVRHKYCSAQGYWDGRAEILNILRPNRAPVGTFGRIVRTLPNGAKRALSVMIENGPGFVPHRSGWDEFAYEEALRFVAHNPVWFDPNQHVQTILLVGEDQLVFPATFPIFFGATLAASSDVPYGGNWLEYPYLSIIGPIINPTIINATTGERLSLIYNLPAGGTIIIDLTYSVKSIALPDGTNLIPYLTEDSDLTTFHLEPGNGTLPYSNTITVTGEAASVSPATSVVISWYDRYIGV